MKKIVFFFVLLLAMLPAGASVSVEVEGFKPSTAEVEVEETSDVASFRKELMSVVTDMESRVSALREEWLEQKRAYEITKKSGNGEAAVAAKEANATYKRWQEALDLKKEVEWVLGNPLGGQDGQEKFWAILHDSGIRSESYLKSHYGLVPVNEKRGREEKNNMNEMIFWAIMALIVVVVIAATMLLRSSGNFFPRDPNCGVAASAASPNQVGLRSLRTSRGLDYHEEVVKSEAALASEALATSNNLLMVLEMHRQQRERVAALSSPVSSEQQPSVVPPAAPPPPTQRVEIVFMGDETPPVTPSSSTKTSTKTTRRGKKSN